MLNKEGSWIKIYRSLLDWEWYDDINTCRLFIHLLLTANYEDKKWHGMVIKRGQRFCSSVTLAGETGLSRQNIRTSLAKLSATEEITYKSTRQGMLITLVKYEKYQEVPTGISTNSITNEQPTINHDLRKKEYNNTPLTPLKGGNTGGEKTETAEEETATLTPELINQKEGAAKGQARGKREKKEKYFLTLNEARSFIRNRVKDPSLAEVMAEWAKMRYAKKGEHRLTEKAINDTLKRLESMGYTTVELAVACYEQSISRLWDDVFELKARG